MADLLTMSPEGLYCARGGFHVDPWGPVPRAVLTHAHADHARGGSGAYLCAAPGLPIARHRLPGATVEAWPYGERRSVGEVQLSFHPAGHVLGSAQLRIEVDGEVWVVSGDYKRAADPTCVAFEPVRADVFLTEATFGLPVFRWEPTGSVIEDLLGVVGDEPRGWPGLARLLSRPRKVAAAPRRARAAHRPAGLRPRRHRRHVRRLPRRRRPPAPG